MHHAPRAPLEQAAQEDPPPLGFTREGCGGATVGTSARPPHEEGSGALPASASGAPGRPAPMRVAVVGAGVAGTSCSWQLLQAARHPVAVTLFEMGRGAGGRASTRRSRELPGLGLNHGAPLFHLRPSAEVADLVEALRAARHIVEWQGTSGSVDAATGALGQGPASRGEPAAEAADFERFVGSPGMSALADGILRLPAAAPVETRYSTKVSSMQPRPPSQGPGWELLDKEGAALGSFDWIVVTSASLAHPRWRQTFGEDPPLHAAARAASSDELTAAMERLQGLRFGGVHVAMLAWAVGEGETAPACVRALPFDVTEVTGDGVLAKVVRQSLGPPYAAVVLHSTAAFAEQHAQVLGSTGTAARMGAVAGSAEQEAAAAQALCGAFERLLSAHLHVEAPAAPTWGPVLHRWGSAFPEGDATAGGAPAAWVLPGAQVAFAGDFLVPPFACVEAALRSGVTAARGILEASEGGQRPTCF
uniref:Amine oxidase domain-containing protein n=1 Tax=Alexandrium monilatum TaxID=311494 RepID=A0A7S4V2X6_9DINO|mmetsp:Transcript_107875/g.343804  ORF Transcript_107875/g.343804 Transcript_107875/m.343804 type:complete len:477 (+) Transcript_107875:22-1452(+)